MTPFTPPHMCQPRKPRNPLVAPAQLRQAGRHRPPSSRQLQGQTLRMELRDLWRPPSPD